MSRHRIPEVTPAGLGVAASLRRAVCGEVSTSALKRWLYSTDASGYRVVPDVVVVAASTDDLCAVAAVASEHGVPVVVRGAGTSLAGQAIGPGIAVDCFKLDRILAVDPGARTACVQPGVIQASLNAAAAPFGLEFGPDTSTVDQATIAGMVANNSSGSRSIIYGESKDKTLAIDAVLANGERLRLGRTSDGDLRSGLAGPAAGHLAGALVDIRGRYGQAIATGFPNTRRCTSGYNLRELLEPQPNLARLLAGSEGSLALFTELEVALDPRPAVRVGAALTFSTLRGALEANVAILDTRPSAIELLDLDPLRRAPNLGTFRRMAPLLAGDDQAMLTVEYQGDEGGAWAGLARLRALTPVLGATTATWLEEPAALAEAAALRRAALPLLMGAPGAERPASFVEDTAVAPERLADFVSEFQALVASHGARASYTGHASAGCLHIRPLLDLKTAAGVHTFGTLAAQVAELVASHQGAISGEHGCGRSRSWLLPRMLGPQLFAAMEALKDAFDPRRLLAPGVVVDGPPVDEGLRFGADYHGHGAWSPRLSHAAEGGFDAAVEKCFGAGQCKKLSGTMCPPAMASRDEARSTRARANALQGVVCGAVPLEAIGEDEFCEVLGTCVACKACKSECPAGVDMAALKVEWLAELRARTGTPVLARAIGEFRRLAALASPAAPLVNALAGTPVVRIVADSLGVAHRRPLPGLARRPLTRRFDGRARPEAVASPRFALFVDCFVQYQEPGIGEALHRLLAAAGIRLELVDAGCCGRTALSTGQIDKARAAAQRAAGPLCDLARAGVQLLYLEPSCLSMIHDDWLRLLPGDKRVALVAAMSRPALELVAALRASGRLRFSGGGRAILHTHCHEKALSFAAETERALRGVPGLELQVLDAGCCGMAGVFGYEADHYEMSVAIAERVLLPAVRAARPDTVVLATGTSCRSQIRDLSGCSALHPLEFLAGRLLV
jgi:FAD/FMN-containing dehydrogenase/Fe-S oxidoreductase